MLYTGKQLQIFTRLCETPEPHNEEDNISEGNPHMLEDVKEKMNVTLTFEQYL
jgi:hypothetical protein